MEEDIYTILGNQIRKARLDAGMTQEQLGEEADIHNSFLGYIERGRKQASVRTLKKIADALSTDIRNFFYPVRVEQKKKDYSVTNKIDSLLRDKTKSTKDETYRLVRMFLKDKK